MTKKKVITFLKKNYMMTPFVTQPGDTNLSDATANIISIFFRNPFTVHKRLIKNSRCRYNDDLPRIGGGQSSPTNPHSGISGGGSVKIPQVSGEYTVTI